MPVDYYPQKSVNELLTILASLQARGSTGVVHFTTAAGMQQQKTFQGSTTQVSVEIRRVLYSLHLKGQLAVENAEAETNPYPNPYQARIRRTRARYTFS